jgi:hypothetical protein
LFDGEIGKCGVGKGGESLVLSISQENGVFELRSRGSACLSLVRQYVIGLLGVNVLEAHELSNVTELSRRRLLAQRATHCQVSTSELKVV